MYVALSAAARMKAPVSERKSGARSRKKKKSSAEKGKIREHKAEQEQLLCL